MEPRDHPLGSRSRRGGSAVPGGKTGQGLLQTSAEQISEDPFEIRKDEIRIRRELFRQADRKDLWSALREEHAKETLKRRLPWQHKFSHSR